MGNSLCSGTTVLNNNFRLQKMLVLYYIHIYHLYIPSIYTTLTIYTPHCNIHKEIYIHTTTIVNRRRN